MKSPYTGWSFASDCGSVGVELTQDDRGTEWYAGARSIIGSVAPMAERGDDIGLSVVGAALELGFRTKAISAGYKTIIYTSDDVRYGSGLGTVHGPTHSLTIDVRIPLVKLL